jgi:hypothetical protein
MYIIPLGGKTIISHLELRLLPSKCLVSKKTIQLLFYNHSILFLQPSKRDVAQLVEYTSGGRVVAGSSPVIPTKKAKQH